MMNMSTNMSTRSDELAEEEKRERKDDAAKLPLNQIGDDSAGNVRTFPKLHRSDSDILLRFPWVGIMMHLFS
jgi:hypothetical protein